MNLMETINADFMAAYKNKEMDKKNYLGFLKSEVTKESKTPDDAYIIAKFKSFIKKAEETNSLSEAELEILNTYIPSQLTEENVTEIVTDFIAENPNVNMGMLMGHLKKNYGGQYDGRMASTIVKGLL